MALQPVKVCDVAMDLGVSTNGGYEIINGSINIDICKKSIGLARYRIIKNECNWSKNFNEKYLRQNIFPPDIEQLHTEAVVNGYSSHGEMFSALTMAKLASLHQSNQSKVYLVKRDLWTEHEKQIMQKAADKIHNKTIYKRYFDTESYNNILVGNGIDNDRQGIEESIEKTTNISQQYGIRDRITSRDQPIDNIINEDDISTDIEMDNSDEDSDKYELKEELVESHQIDVDPNSPLWKMTVVHHLMRGNLIAVW